MGRPRRAADGGAICHVLNRGDSRMPIFEKDGDYEAFERILEEGVERYDTGLLAWCLMPNHWHQVVKSHSDGEVVSRPGRGALFQRMSLCRAKRVAGQSGEASGGLAMAPGEHCAKTAAGTVAGPAIPGVAGTCQHTAKRMVKRLGRESTLPPHSRPKKNQNGS
jgi:REP element-mobilizing transposase RayT